MRTTLRFIGFSALSALFVPFLAFAAQVTVTLSAGAITPANITINPGDTVIWSNTSGSSQSVTANNGTFESGTIAPGGSFAATFPGVGTYQYYDNANGSAVIGSVVVRQSAVQTNPNANYYGGAGTQTTANASSLSAQTQALIAQIAQLEAQLQNGGSASGSVATNAGGCPTLTRTLGIGMSGSDVSALQSFLARNASIYPEGQVTGYFGALTQVAVQRFQAQYGVVSSGTPSSTGYGVVGPRTIAMIGSVCANGSNAGANSGTSAQTGNPNAQQTVSGYMQVSPISGAAPLSVNANVTVNTANSCTGATYALNWGDGSAAQTITVPQGNCAQQNQVLQHTYAAAGTYQVILSAGGHSSTTNVVVTGSGSNSATNPTQPAGSITAFTTSGAVPLNVTFYVSCSSGLAYDVIYGDGQELGGSGVSQSSCDGGLQSIPHTYAAAGNYTAQLVAFVRNSQGTITTQTLGTVQINAGGASSTVTGSASTYASPMVNSNYNGNPLAISLQFTALQCGSAYQLQWGDEGSGLGGTTTGDCTSGTPAGQTTTWNPNHTYAAPGTYTITLKRNIYNGAAQTDTVNVVITQ